MTVPGLTRRPVVLTYHGVGPVGSEGDPARLVVPTDRLAAHVRLLQRRGYRFSRARDVVGRTVAPGEAVLTFDDGFADWVPHLLPLLERLEVPASLYVNPGLVDGRSADVPGAAGRLLDARGLRVLAEHPLVDLGSHAWTHRDLRTLGDDELRRELVDSRDAVEQLTGEPCLTVAYPYGLHDARVREAASDAGYLLAWDWLQGRWHDRMAAPRLPAPTRGGAGVLLLKTMGVRRRGVR